MYHLSVKECVKKIKNPPILINISYGVKDVKKIIKYNQSIHLTPHPPPFLASEA